MEEQTKSKGIAVTWGLLRHILTGGGAALIQWGIMTPAQAGALTDNWAIIGGSISAIAGVIGSIVSKVRKKPAA